MRGLETISITGRNGRGLTVSLVAAEYSSRLVCTGVTLWAVTRPPLKKHPPPGRLTLGRRDHGYCLLGPDDPLHREEIVLGVHNATSDVRSVDSVIEEREREELGEELGVIRRAVENEITDPADFVPAKRDEGVGQK